MLRIIHTLDALGAAWHRDLFLRHGRKPVADNWRGFIPHGRREGPSLVLQAVIVRPAAIVRCVLVTLLDMANAFGSTHFEAMRRAVAERPQSGFFTNWRESATIVLAGCDGKITMRPNRGGLMGERNEPDFFGEVFAGPIGRWSTHTRLHMDEGKALWSTSPIDGRTVDLSMCGYADDVENAFVLDKEKVAERGAAAVSAEIQKESNQVLSAELQETGHTQSLPKQVAIPVFAGVGNVHETKIALKDSTLEGRAALNARYLGPQIHYKALTAAERPKRLKAMESGWREMGKFWFSDHVRNPWRLIKATFISKVVNSGLNGMEAMLIDNADYTAIDKVTSKYSRALLAGAPSGRRELGGKMIFAALTNAQVLGRMRIPRSGAGATHSPPEMVAAARGLARRRTPGPHSDAGSVRGRARADG